MTELYGKPTADKILAVAKENCDRLKQRGVIPTLAVIRVGAKAEDLTYERALQRRFEAVGAAVQVCALKETVAQSELENLIKEKNRDPFVHGILLFFPLPASFDNKKIRALIAPEKDVDGQTDTSIAAVFCGDKNAFAPCTAQAVMEILSHSGISLAGKRVTVVGRSLVVGRPLAMLFLAENATPTICHSKTTDLASDCSRADIVVAAVGIPDFISERHLGKGQVLVDVGMNMTPSGLCGDINKEAAQKKADFYTPVPGGVGAVTSAVLLSHTIQAARNQTGM